MTTLLNAELSRLCADKGYKRPKGYSQPYYNHLGILNGDVTELVKAQINEKDTTPFQTISAPTIVEVVMWLYEKHGIWIIPSYELNIENHKKEWFWIAIKDGEEIAYQYRDFNSPTEAYEAAIDYTLNNLI